MQRQVTPETSLRRTFCVRASYEYCYLADSEQVGTLLGGQARRWCEGVDVLGGVDAICCTALS